ncbi:hypothetical protein Droror1_Dr00025449 [Drosera rotundifolia]
MKGATRRSDDEDEDSSSEDKSSNDEETGSDYDEHGSLKRIKQSGGGVVSVGKSSKADTLTTNSRSLPSVEISASSSLLLYRRLGSSGNLALLFFAAATTTWTNLINGLPPGFSF